MCIHKKTSECNNSILTEYLYGGYNCIFSFLPLYTNNFKKHLILDESDRKINNINEQENSNKNLVYDDTYEWVEVSEELMSLVDEALIKFARELEILKNSWKLYYANW